MLGTMSVAKATTFYVKITISDTCSPGNYTGKYCVRWELTYNGTVLCTSQNCTLSAGGPQCISFNCSVPPYAEDNKYGIRFVSAARYPSGNCITYTGSGTNNLYWADIIDNTCVASINVTL